MTETRPGVWIVDFGRTTAGWTKLRVTADAGTTISLTHGETVADGNVVAVNGHVEGDRIQRDEYIAAGNGVEEWEPRFSYKGFRYVQIEGVTERPDVLMRVVHSDVRDGDPVRLDAAVVRAVRPGDAPDDPEQSARDPDRHAVLREERLDG